MSLDSLTHSLTHSGANYEWPEPPVNLADSKDIRVWVHGTHATMLSQVRCSASASAVQCYVAQNCSNLLACSLNRHRPATQHLTASNQITARIIPSHHITSHRIALRFIASHHATHTHMHRIRATAVFWRSTCRADALAPMLILLTPLQEKMNESPEKEQVCF